MTPRLSELLHAETELEHLEPLIDINSEEDVADVQQLQSYPSPVHKVCRKRNLLTLSGIVVFGLLVVLLLHLGRPNHPDGMEHSFHGLGIRLIEFRSANLERSRDHSSYSAVLPGA
jgi:hypothetical protein